MTINAFSKEFNDVKLIKGKNIKDARGIFKKTIYGDNLKNLMPNPCEQLNSTSKKNVIRGLHYQRPPFQVSKFITCIHGEIIDVFLNIKKDSPYYGFYDSVKLSEDDDLAIFIPEGYAHGFSVTSDIAVVSYLQSGDYNENYDMAINPFSINVDWKIKNPIVSEKDLNAVKFKNLKSEF